MFREPKDKNYFSYSHTSYAPAVGTNPIGKLGRTTPTHLYALWGKRCFDIVGAFLLLPLALPLIVILAAFVAIDGSKPIYSHRRVGKNGRAFPCFKIRTMVADSEARLKKLLREDPAAAAEWNRDFKLRKDPRITRLGRILRKTSLDELPQIWNVIRGDMSLVGPRPVTKDELPLYRHVIDSYMSVRPGMTGLWQISGRNDISYEERVELDHLYSKNLSLLEDLRILFMTLPAALRMTGA
ncbi:sugar transferase [Phaeobacter gallaeciensis]|uniref:sugar transferase n=1 Tax=Phaeobacter gallaeciensis TaxID=60890 RepID=UPI002380BA77|nr:sugar transferase [Phaeobacter gallaeciensis]MDE4276505.1 sugar transferase [Phaeobacter gallaeciensis]MDE4301754.1 sugar transferase [Phaeobacter gallaeciensis]MDE5186907.1 sugar transferase [Phaeobacter gallaeciensis]